MMWCDVMWCDVMWCDVVVWCVGLRDAVLWTTESPCHSKTGETSIPMRGATLGCKTQGKYGEPMSQKCGSVRQRTPRCYKVLPPTTDPCDSCNTWNVMYIAPSNLRDANTMELPHSCLIIATHEKSFALCRAAEITPQHRQILRPPGNLTTKISHISPNIALPRKVIGQLS